MSDAVEIWGGIECTVNRVGDAYIDQLELSGRAARIEDLGLFARLGIRRLRLPVLWERLAPAAPDELDWRLTDLWVARARELGLGVIAGLVHHGSGPRYTSLEDPGFPAKLATFAARVAERYPWIDAYTPVNEPLTTARFSGLYGHWFPHKRDTPSLLRMLQTQCIGVARAMAAIRAVNPGARLVQTEDLGRVFSTPFLGYQAAYENERRWLSLDLLTGRVKPGHLFFDQCLAASPDPEATVALADVPCPPDVIGVNHYLTSNRFLDERLERYAIPQAGGNGRHRYVDVEAVRVGSECVAGHAELLREAWERYALPLAITEVHLSCSRDEQMRWLGEAWNACQALREGGVDVRAMAAWALLGSNDWDSLVTQPRRHYESGVFDVRGPEPRPTALADMILGLATHGAHDHPVLDVPGWWRRSTRLLYPPVTVGASTEVGSLPARDYRRGAAEPRRLLLIGLPGTLATAFTFGCERRGLPFRALRRADVELTDRAAIAGVLRETKPWAVINAAGFVRVDDAESFPDHCYRDNVSGPAVLADLCAGNDTPLMTFSSDLVFSGESRDGYRENSVAEPLSVYGRSKRRAEEEVLSRYDRALVIRTSAFFGPWDEANFLTVTLREVAAGREVRAASDLIMSPTYVPDLVEAALDLLIDGVSGIWHLANVGATTWADFAREAVRMAGLTGTRVIGTPQAELGLVAPRPPFSVLMSERGLLLPELGSAVARYLKECRVAVS